MNQKRELTTLEKIQQFEANKRDHGAVVTNYRLYHGYTDAQKTLAAKEWREYYEKCHNSPIAQEFRDLRQAFAKGNLDEIRERVAWIKELHAQGDLVPKPKWVDPFVIANDSRYIKYHNLQTQLAQEREQQVELAPIFE